MAMVMPRSFSSGALSIWSKATYLLMLLALADTLVSAAVRVVLPWSICPIVPTFTCGLLRSNFSLAMSTILCLRDKQSGADVQDRTGDLVLTKDALCQLSYIGSVNSCCLRAETGAGDGDRTRDQQL